MTPDSVFARRLWLLLVAVTGAFVGMGLGVKVLSPTYLSGNPWVLPLFAAGGAALAMALVFAAKWRLG
jgi:hypothetical protein